MFGLRSARGRATLVGLALTLFLVGITAFTIWRAQSDSRQLHELERASDTASALEHARAQLYLQITLLSGLGSSEDAGLVEEYRQAQAALEQDLIRARAEATASGDAAQLAVLDDLTVRMAEFEATANLAIPLLLQSDAPTAMELTANYLPSVQDAMDAMFVDLDQLAQNGRTNLAAERAAMDSDADVTFWLIIARGALAFVLTAGIATVVLLSILRPLATLRLSARAIAAGNLNARARVHGPEEVASLARDFNRMTDALAAKTEEYVTTTNLTGDIIGRLDVQNRWTFLNDAACQFYGKPRERLLGTDAAATLHPEDLESTARELQEARASKELRQGLVNRVVTPLGTRVVEWNAYPLFDKKGGDAGFQITGRDITERNRVQEALRESEARYRLLAENTSDLIWTMDLSLRYTYMSPAVTRMRGYSVEEIVGTTIQETMTPASLEAAREAFAEELAAERTGQAAPLRSRKIDLEMYCKDGSTIWTEMNMTFLRDPDGRPIGILGVTRDITERKRAEEALLRQGAVLGVINRVLRETLSCETDGDVARVCIEEAQKLTSSDFGFIGEVNQAGRFDTIALTDPGWEACRMPRSSGVRMIKDMELRGIWSKVLRDERPVLVNDPASHPDRVGTPEGHPPLTSFLGVPLKHRGKTIGMIGLANKASGYDVADQENVEAISTAFVEALSRNRAEGALEESERRYRLIAENATDLIWTTDMSLRYTYISPSVLRLRGYSVEEAMAHTVEQDLCPSSLDVAMKALAEEVARSESEEKAPYRWRTLELEHLCKDGSTVWLEVTTTFLRDEDGRPVGLLGASRDISERKQSEEALRESEEKYRSLVQDATEGIAIVAGLEVKFVNRALLKMYGGESEEEMVGRPLTDLVAPEHRELMVERSFAREKGQDVPDQYEFKALHKDGTKFDAELSVSLITYEGRVARQGVIRDITERKRIDDALRESEARYRLLAENTSDLIWTMDLSLRYTYMSPAITRMRGYSVEEIVGTTIQETMTPASLEVARNALAEELALERAGQADPSRSRKIELEMCCKDGSTIWTEMNTTFLRDSDGRPVGILGVTRDISERKQAEEALRQSVEEFGLVFENAKDAVFWADPETGLIIRSNRAAESLLEKERAEIVGQHQTVLHPPQKAAHYAEMFKTHIEEEGSVDDEAEVITKSGRITPVHITASVIPVGGKPIIQGIFRDITERKEAEAALRMKDSAMASSINAIALAGQEGTLTYVNPSFLRMWGYDEEKEVLGTHVSQFWQTKEKAFEVGRELRAEGNWGGELVAIRRDGSPFIVDMLASTVTDEAGNPICIMGSFLDVTERKRAVQALEEGERRYRLLAENVSDVIFTADLSMRYTYVSPSVTRTRGYSVEEVMAGTLADSLAPGSLELAQKVLAEQLAKEAAGGRDLSRTVEVELNRKDGSTIWAEVTASFLRNSDGQPIGLLGVSRDISERKRVEEGLRQAEQRYRELFEEAPAMYLICRSQDGVPIVADCNELFLSTLGYTRAEVVGQPMAHFYTPQSRAELLEGGGFQRALAGQFVAEERQLLARDGRIVETVLHAAPELDAEGQVLGTRAMYVDITQRKQAEEALDESERRYRLLAENASDIIWTMDMNLRYTYESPAVTRIRGYTPEEAMAQTIEETLTPASLDLARKALAEELTARKMAKDLSRSRTLELEHTCKDGSTVWLEVTTTFLRDEDGLPVGILGASRDISERKRGEEERQRLHVELETRAVTDSLTGLYNHAYFYQRLPEEIDRSKRYGHRFALVMMDLDAFKHYNDSRGHQAGDAALHLVGECIQSAMRRSDMAFRYGGDEFATILLNADVSKAQDVVRRINRRIATRLKEAGDSAGAWLGVSAGVACFPEDATTVDELVRMADTAMYDAKRLAWARGVMGRGQAVESAGCQVEVPHETQTGMLSGVASSLTAALKDLTGPDVVAESDLRTIAALGAAAEIKDPFILGHHERTSRLAGTLAEEMGLSHDRVRNITTASLVHDLGKVNVGESILNKPGKLSESEFAKMKEHPALGATMIGSGAGALQPLAPIVRHHHERFDGGGYPDGLARENIPLEARILGVADAFDAMTHERSYRKALSTEEALGEIERGAGTRFDSAVVEAFLGIMRRRGGELG